MIFVEIFHCLSHRGIWHPFLSSDCPCPRPLVLNTLTSMPNLSPLVNALVFCLVNFFYFSDSGVILIQFLLLLWGEYNPSQCFPLPWCQVPGKTFHNLGIFLMIFRHAFLRSRDSFSSPRITIWSAC